MNAPTDTRTSGSLYERLGGASGIAALVDDIVLEHMNNPVINARFLPIQDDPARLAQIKRHTCAFLGMGSGGPEQYTGRSMPAAHRGMNISGTEYLAVVDDILAVLRKHGKDEQTQKDVLAIAFALKSEIMGL